jgi:glycosyltransferase involved in cell wall biosynthesis
MDAFNTPTEDYQRVLEAKDAQISELNRALEAKDAQISELNRALEAKDVQIAELENTLKAKDTQVRSLEIHIQQMEHGIVMQLLHKCERAVEALLPQGTRRRYYCGLGLAGIRVTLSEGWRSFWIKAKTWFKQKTNAYQLWIAQNEPSKGELARYRQESLSFRFRPKISIITPIWNADEKQLRLAIESILNQVYDNWELCIVGNGSAENHVSRTISKYAEKEPRLKVKLLSENKGISGNYNEALSLASGEFVGFLDDDDELAVHALYEVAKVLNEKPQLDLIYSDEDRVTNEGKRSRPFLKPDWSPDMLLSCMYTGRLGVYRKAILDDIGGFRIGYGDAAEYDLVLRFIEKTSKIYHIPAVLYHNRVKKVSSRLINGGSKEDLLALKDYLVRNGIEGEVLSSKWKGSYRVKRRILGNPVVSIIIPTKDKLNFLRPCIKSILDKTDYDNYEIIIVNNQSREPKTLHYLEEVKEHPKVRVLGYDRPFNFSAINNYAASQANGEYILFLNNDTKVISEEWLSAMLEHAQRKEVGLVGCLLLYPNSKIQHAGVIIGSGSLGRHSHRYLPASRPGYYLRPHLVQNLSAATAACVLLRKEVFQEVHGFDENLPIACSDVDICLKIKEKGYLIVYTPYAKLCHPELTTRGRDDTPEKQARVRNEEAYMRSKWGQVIDKVDPYYNPGLTLTREDFSLGLRLGVPVQREFDT